MAIDESQRFYAESSPELCWKSQRARAQLEQMMATQQANMYTIEKHGKKTLIYQAPWYRDGEYSGFMEIMMDIPGDMPHFVRE